MDKWPGKFEMVDPNKIVVDRRYQRPENELLISQITADFDWAAFGAVSLYRRNGSLLVVVDGQQRIRGALRTSEPPELIPAVIQDKTSVEGEARTYVKMNIVRRSVPTLDRHRGNVIAKDPAALGVARAVEKAGFTLGGVTSAGDANTVSAVSAVYDAYNTLGEEGLVQVLTQARDSWPDDPAATSVRMIRVLTEVLLELGTDYNRPKVTAARGRSSPILLTKKAKELNFEFGGSLHKNMRRAVKTLCKI